MCESTYMAAGPVCESIHLRWSLQYGVQAATSASRVVRRVLRFVSGKTQQLRGHESWCCRNLKESRHTPYEYKLQARWSTSRVRDSRQGCLYACHSTHRVEGGSHTWHRPVTSCSGRLRVSPSFAAPRVSCRRAIADGIWSRTFTMADGCLLACCCPPA